MITNMQKKVALIILFIALYARAEKQIKLEDIEKDNLKADQEVKLQKQLQQQYQQQIQYNPIDYENHAKNNYHIFANYQPQSQQQQGYVVPYTSQQLLQSIYRNYPQLSNNHVGSNYQASANPFQSYFAQQSVLPAAMGNQRPIIMAIMPNTLSHPQVQSNYLQGILGHPYQNYQNYQQQQQAPVYYTQLQPVTEQRVPAQPHYNVAYNNPQQYLSQLSSMIQAKGSPITYQFTSGTSSNYPQHYSVHDYNNNNQEFSSSGNAAIFLPTTRLTQQHLPTSASPGQHQQYLQAQTSTVSPLPVKFLNSPQYLAQNYNTITSSSHFAPKDTFASATKSTSLPPIKVTPSPSYLSTNQNYHSYRNFPG